MLNLNLQSIDWLIGYHLLWHTGCHRTGHRRNLQSKSTLFFFGEPVCFLRSMYPLGLNTLCFKAPLALEIITTAAFECQSILYIRNELRVYSFFILFLFISFFVLFSSPFPPNRSSCTLLSAAKSSLFESNPNGLGQVMDSRRRKKWSITSCPSRWIPRKITRPSSVYKTSLEGLSSPTSLSTTLFQRTLRWRKRLWVFFLLSMLF